MSVEELGSDSQFAKHFPVVSEILLDLVVARGVEKTFCPSEAARKFDAADWRRHMPLVRAVGVALWREKRLGVFQKGAAVENADVATGPVRYGLPR